MRGIRPPALFELPAHAWPHAHFVLRRGSLRPLLRRGRRLVGMKGIAPQGCQILSLDPLLFGFNHMPANWCIRQDSHLQTLRSKRRMIIISPRMRKWSRWRDLHSRGAMCLAVYETAAVAAEPHRPAKCRVK